MDRRQVVLDTETTGLEVSQGHRVIEIGCVELINRKLTGRNYHQYIHPQRSIDEGALAVHGITLEFLENKPFFAQVAKEFLSFVEGSELIIHNAPFDVGFIDAELERLDRDDGSLSQACTFIDTLQLARSKHPGQRNSLDALCQRYEIDNANRALHGALLDAELLAEVYLSMTGGQTSLGLGSLVSTHQEVTGTDQLTLRRLSSDRPALSVLRASPEELTLHEEKLIELDKIAGKAVWRRNITQTID